MAKSIPTIQKYMTTLPFTIDRTATLAAAHKLMRAEGIRHLPVMDGGDLVGILSDRDLHLVESLKDVDPTKVQIEDAMVPQPYAVSPEARLDEVVAEMAQKKYGAVVVMVSKRVVGVFTTVDAMKAFADLLHTRLAA